MARIAINGLGRIGRIILKLAMDDPEVDLVAVNDPIPLENLIYLLRYDTVYGRYERPVDTSGSDLMVDGQRIRALAEPRPEALPWRELDIDLVFECSGVFRKQQDLEKHLTAGARRAMLSAPPKGGDLPQLVYGVSDSSREAPTAFSTASCTTNCIAPVLEVIDRRIGVLKAMLTTVHAYTANQGIVDSPADRMERGRAGAANLVPTSTGAATATAAILPQLDKRFDGIAIRAPVAVGSIADITLLAGRATTVDEVNAILREEAASARYRGILGVTDQPIVSADIIRDGHASLVDLAGTRVVDGDLVKVLSWYDNEWGYASQMYRQARQVLSGQ